MRHNASHTATRPACLTIAATLIFFTTLTAAQTQPNQAARPVSVEFDEAPFRRDSIGLEMYLPVGAEAASNEIGGMTNVRINLPDMIGLINVQTARAEPDQTVNSVGDEIIRKREESVSSVVRTPGDNRTTRTQAVTFDRASNMVLDGKPVDRFYISTPAYSGPAIVYGYTIFLPTSERIVTFELITTEPNLPIARALYEATMARVAFTDPADIALRRGTGLSLGAAVVSQLTPSDFASVVAPTGPNWEWHRLHIPARTGADADSTELGYRRVAAYKGSRGELGSAAGARATDAAGRQDGYVVRVESRTLTPEGTIDSAGAFFMTPDGQEESWTIRMAIRNQGAKPAVWTETGARSGRSMTIITSGAGTAPTETRPVIEGEGYVSRALAFLLPELLVRKGVPGDYRFYAYNSRAGKITLRADTLEQPADRPNVWRLTTRLSEDEAPQFSLFAQSGDLIHTDLPNDAGVWEPIDLDRLVRLWKSKNLPMD
ncbi:MAG TPA: hypothetical protein PLU35_02840 [Phycisphaerales bacterium]|nr:hypothetical protein [Phycisphaerales bacterium]